MASKSCFSQIPGSNGFLCRFLLHFFVLMRRIRVAWSVLALMVCAPAAHAQSGATDHGAVVTKYCVTCHNERTKIAGLMLDKANIADPSATADIWEKAIRKRRGGMIPPQNTPHPDAQTQTSLLPYLTTATDRAG